MREDKGQYKKKHGEEAVADRDIAAAVQQKIVNGKISCVEASTIAQDLRKPMIEVGLTLDLLEVSINKCQLGLFGYYPKKKILSPAQSIDPKLEEAIRQKQIKGFLSCVTAWEIAEAFALPKIEVASVCEALGIKINACQLGSF